MGKVNEGNVVIKLHIVIIWYWTQKIPKPIHIMRAALFRFVSVHLTIYSKFIIVLNHNQDTAKIRTSMCKFHPKNCVSIVVLFIHIY